LADLAERIAQVEIAVIGVQVGDFVFDVAVAIEDVDTDVAEVDGGCAGVPRVS
jgi:hypothetical protein